MFFFFKDQDAGSRQILIHQTLHGYDEGHRLLESSVTLSPESSRQLLSASDMSGSTMVKSFERYTTFYPLAKNNLYVVARTWYAEEMKRPGCVWTHSLLIDFSDLAQVDDILEVTRLFSKPAGVTDTERFKRPLTFEGSSERESGSTLTGHLGLMQLCSSIYGSPDTQVILEAGCGEEFLKSLSAIWNQQWPKLRRRFSFCTGSLGSLKVGDKLLDVCCVPRSVYQHLRVPRSKKLNPNSPLARMPDKTILQSLEFLISDLVTERTSFRQFTRTCAIDLRFGRGSMLALASVFQSLVLQAEPSYLAGQVGCFFPGQEEAGNLKEHLLGDAAQRGQWNSGPTDVAILYGIVHASFFSDAFSPKTLNVRSRAKIALESEPRLIDCVLKLVRDHSRVTPIAACVMLEHLARPETDISHHLSGVDRIFWRELIGQDLALLENSVTWERISGREATLTAIDALRETVDPSDDSLLDSLLSAVLTSGNFFAIEGMEELLGVRDFRERFCTVYFSLDGDFPEPVRSIFGDIVSRHPDVVAAKLNSASVGVKLRRSLIDIAVLGEAEYFARTSLARWLPIAELTMSNLRSQAKVCVFLFALAMLSTDEEGAYIVAFTFRPIYMLAKHDRLDYYSWRILREIAPSRHFLDWDKCARLSFSVAIKFAAQKWPPTVLVNTFEGLIESRRLIQILDSERHSEYAKLVVTGLSGSA